MLRILAGNANAPLAHDIAATLGLEPTGCRVDRFPDGELDVAVDPDVAGGDCYIVQPTSPPVDRHLLELFLLVDACRRAGADRLSAVIPYFGYARQDRRGEAGEPVSVRVIGHLLASVDLERVVVVDPHSPDLEAIVGLPTEPVTAVPVLADAVARDLPDNAVVVAPDLGAVELAEEYAGHLRRPVAVVRKTRVSGDTVRADQVVGDVRGQAPVIVDDMISTGGTIEAAARALMDAGAQRPITVAATHGLFVGDAPQRFGELQADRLIVTDTVPPGRLASAEVVGVAGRLAEAVQRLHERRSLAPLEAFR